MIVYEHDPTVDEAPASSIKAWMPRGACAIDATTGSRVLWIHAAECRTVAAAGLVKIEAGLELADLTTPQLRQLAVHLGAKTRAKKKASLVKALAAHLEGLGA